MLRYGNTAAQIVVKRRDDMAIDCRNMFIFAAQMKIEKKTLKEEAQRLIGIYDKYDIPYIPKLLDYIFTGNDCILGFEWIDGMPPTEADAQRAFYLLGKMHLI